MSVEAITWVLNEADVSGTDKVVLLGIANHADEDGQAWPSVERLARYARVSERAVQQSLTRLVRDGWVSVERNAGGKGDTRSDRRPNRYTLAGRSHLHPAAVDGVKPSASRGEGERAHGVKPASPESSIEPSLEPSEHSSTPLALVDVAALVELPFADFWNAYPNRNGKRVGRAEAEREWNKLSRRERRGAMTGVEHYRAACDGELTMAKDAHRWLRSRAWLDWQTPATSRRVVASRNRAVNERWANGSDGWS